MDGSRKSSGSNFDGKDISEINNEGSEGSKAWQNLGEDDGLNMEIFRPKRSNFLDANHD